MFKKPVKISAQNQLSGKDRKVIKSKLSDYLDNDCVQKLLTANQKIISCKISGAKMLIYNGDQYPLFVDGTGKNNYFPSLYVATAYQPLIKTLTINEGVETYIYNGANLMWPGVRDYEGLGQFTKDQTVGIRNSKGQIIAIGAMGCSKKQLTDNNGVAVYILHYHGDKLWQMGTKTFPQVIVPLKVQEKKQQVKQEPKMQQAPQQKNQQLKKAQEKPKKDQGKDHKDLNKEQSSQKKQKSPEASEQSSEDEVDLMSLVHQKNQSKGRVIKMQQKGNLKNAFVEDQNEEKNTKNKKKQNEAPKAQKGKQKGGKNRKQQSEQDKDVMQEQEQQPQTKKNQKDSKKGGKKKGKEEKKGKKKQSQSQEQESQAPNKKQNKKGERSDQDQKQGQQKSTINSKLMDQYFKQSMLNAIKLTKIQAELPIDSGKFYMDYMLLARPEGVKLDIKQSTYKKIGKFFEEMAKKKIIQYKHPKDKKAQGATINKIFWQNEQLKNHAPTIKKLGSKQEQQKQKVQTYSKTKLKLSKTVQLQTVYKPSQDLFDEMLKRPLNLMPAEGQTEVTDKQQVEYITQKQLRQKIQKYINKMDSNKEKQKEGGKKIDKTILIDYSKHQYLRELLKKQIEEYEENKQKDQILKADQMSDDQGDKKKKKNKKGAVKQCLKVDRHYLAEKLMKKASPYHHLHDAENDVDRFKQGTFKGIQLTAQKANNKNITRITGLELFITPKTQVDEQIHGLANILQTKFACSVNVHNLPGKNAGKEIIAHGSFIDELEQMLIGEYELPAKFITTLNKLDKKKKNN